MRTYQYTTFTVLDRCDILYAGQKSDLHNVLKRVSNRNARLRFVFGIKDDLLNVRRILRIWHCAYLLHLNYIKSFCILHFGG
jgi:hypothetical protein